jgi:ubiquitin-protein ligase
MATDATKTAKKSKASQAENSAESNGLQAQADAAVAAHKKSALGGEISLKSTGVKANVASFKIKHSGADDAHLFAVDASDAKNFVVSTDDELLEDAWLIPMIQFCANNKPKDLAAVVAEAVQRFNNMEDEGDDDDDDDNVADAGRGKAKGKSLGGDFANADDDDDDVFGGEPQPGFSLSTAPKSKLNAPRLRSEDFFTGDGSKMASERLIKDLQAISEEDTKQFGYTVETMDDNLYKWEARLFGFDGDLAKDMKKRGVEAIKLELTFPKDYPFSPPFVRVREPRFAFHTGHVTIGGSICMQALTRSGWSSVFDVESLLVQIRSEMMAGGARLDQGNQTPYTVEEAQAAFTRVAAQHGWS